MRKEFLMSSIDFVFFRAPALIASLNEALSRPARPVILVPQSFTLAVEAAILQSRPEKGILGLSVFSPESLIREINELAGRGGKRTITADGRTMLLSRLLLEYEDRLLFYRQSVHQSGLAQRLSAQIEEFHAAGLSPEKLNSLSLSASTDKKFHDIALLWSAYNEWKSAGYVDGTDQWMNALSRLPASGLMNGAHLIIYGFDVLTDALSSLLLRALSLADQITVGLIMDPDGPDADIFKSAIHSVERFRDFYPGIPATFRSYRCPFPGLPGLHFVESALFSSQALRDSDLPDLSPLTMMYARSSVQECWYIAQTLIAWHREGIAWSDMAVALIETETLPSLLPLILKAAGIPFTVRLSRSVMMSGLVGFFLAMLRAMRDRWRKNDMLQLFRSGFLSLTDEERMDLDNYVLEHGTDHQRWLMPFSGSSSSLKHLEEVRASFMADLTALRAALTDRKCTGRRAAELLYDFLISHDVYSCLLSQEEKALSSGNPETADLNRQSWKILMDVLDQLAVFAPQTHLSLDDLTEMLSASLSAHQIKSLPQTTGTVMVSKPSMFLSGGYAGMVVAGMQQAAAPDSALLITDQERSRLRGEYKIDVGFSREDLAARQKQDVYQVVSLARNRLLLTCSSAAPDGSVLYPSQAFKSLSRILAAHLPDHFISGLSQDCMLPFSPGQALEELSVRLRDNLDLHRAPFFSESGEADSLLWRNTLSWLGSSPAYRAPVRAMFSNLLSVSWGTGIAEAQAEKLYPAAMSPSFAETAALCPCMNWAQRALLLQPRKEFAFTPDQQGSFIHEALCRFFEEMQHMPEWPDITETQVQNILNRLLRKQTSVWKDGPLGDSTVHRYQGAAVIRTVRFLCSLLMESMRRTPHFRPAYMEAGFGLSGDRRFPALPLKTPAGREITLSGIIDRIDLLVLEDGRRFFLIQDYKSSDKDLRWSSIQSGTDLQLPLYLAAVSAALPDYQPAGSVYQPVRELVLEADPVSLPDELRKVAGVRGIVLADDTVQQAMQPLKKASSRAGTDLLPAFTPEELQQLTKESIQVFCEITDWQFSGVTAPQPLLDKDSSPCDYCFLRRSCSWDPRLPGALCRHRR